jgi:hypothetical protein
MLQAISIYLLIGILINVLVDLMYDWMGNNKIDYNLVDTNMSNEKWNNFTKIVVTLLWPICIVYVAIQIFNEYTK